MQVRKAVAVLSLAIVLAAVVFGQAGGSTSISGLVTDSQNALVPGAKISLKDLGTSIERTTTTNDAGRYSFANVISGRYEIRAEATGFSRAIAEQVGVEVLTPVTQDFKLEVGAVTESVMVAGASEAPLVTENASIGYVIRGDTMRKLPNLNRQAGSLLALQPGSTSTGEVAGSRNDQTSIVLDGVEVSDTVIGTAFRTVIPTPVESLEELRVVVANPDATLGRGSGAQAAVVTKRGGNSFHGSAYEYFQNEDLNANRWELNRTGQHIPKLRDNRFGVTTGGPILRNRTFFFAHYEGRRQTTATSVTRVVPSDTLKQGVLLFRDASGAIQRIDPKDYDPRGLGANPAMLNLLKSYPAGNDPSAGVADGLNTIGLVFTVPTPIKDEFGLVRLDHRFSSSWSFDGSFRFARELATNSGQVDTINRQALYNTPVRNGFATGGLTGILSPSMTNRIQFSWLNDRLSFTPRDPAGIPPFNIAIAPGSAQTTPFLNAPYDVDTQRARFQYRTLNYYQTGDQFTWQKSKHQIQAGFTVRAINSVDFRNDKVVGSIATPVADITSGRYNIIDQSQRPSFIQPADVSRYNQFYSTLLGLVEQVPVLGVRDSSLKPLPVGTGLLTHSTLRTWEFYGQDTWRITPSLTFNYGLTYEWQTPPAERDQHQVVMAYKDGGKLVDIQDYLKQKFNAAAAGNIFNPDVEYLPLKDAGRSTAFNIDRSNFSPRVALAWNPRFSDGLGGHLFGDGKTVLRGGYGLIYDRTNTVGTIIVPTLGVGFAQTFTVQGPKNAAGQPFRAGIDGPIPVPTVTAATSPVVPDKPFGEVLSFSVDPNLRVPKSHQFNFTIQRELSNHYVLSISYLGRLGRNLFQNVNMNSVPYNFKDPKSGQTFAQAFDAVAGQLRAGVKPANVTPQSWFENLGGGTTALATSQTTAFINGNVSDLFLFGLDLARLGGGMQPFDNLEAIELFYRTNSGRSNYHAGIITLDKRFSSGFNFNVSYTLSKSLDLVGLNQNNVGNLSSGFNPNIDYGPSFFDRRHLFVTTGQYELPFGKGKRFLEHRNGFVNRLVSDFYVSGIWTAQSGLPLIVTESSQVFGGSDIFGNNIGALPTSAMDYGSGVHQNVAGSSGIGISGNPATKGSGLNLFADPQAVFNNFRPINISSDGRQGRGALRGLPTWDVDFAIGKSVSITEGVKVSLVMESYNIFNHPIFNNPTLNLQTRANFGVITSQDSGNSNGSSGPRRIQLGLRIDF